MNNTRSRQIMRHIAFAILVLLSVLLSWAIWTNPARYGVKKVATEKVQTSQITHEMDDVVLPTEVVHTNKDGKQHLLNDKNVNISKKTVSAVSKWKLGDVSQVSRNNKDRFLDTVNRKNSLLLRYPGNITSKIFNSVFQQKIKFSFQISQIVIDLKDDHKIFLLNDKNYAVYQVKTDKQDTDKLVKLISNSDKSYAVKQTILNHRLINKYTDDINAPYYGFVINKESSSIFTSNLLSNTDTNTIDTNRVKDGIEYVTNDSSKKLLVKNNGYVTFTDEDKDISGSTSIRTNIEQGFLQMKRLGVRVENMRYLGYHADKRETEFIQYVEGFPIFNDDDLSSVKVASHLNKMTTTFSTYNLDVPAPSSKGTKKLEDTDTVLSMLKDYGFDTKKIEDIDLGYQWTGEAKANETVELVPAWYVKYHDRWVTIDSLMS